MAEKEDVQKIKEEVELLFEKMGVQSEIQVVRTENSTVDVLVKLEEPAAYIGQAGQVLGAIQHLLRIIIRRTIPDAPIIDIDINDYKSNKITYLKEMAREAAEDVILTRRAKELPPMPPYERRVVHMELASKEGIITESIGEGEERRVAIKPKE